MPTLITLAIVLISGVLLLAGLAGCSKSTGAEPSQTPAAVEQPVTAEGVSSVSEAALRQMLSELKEAPEPMAKMGAMCYRMAAPSSRFDYVCPKCGEKTVYAHSNDIPLADVWQLSRGLPESRQEAKTLPKSPHITISLDESEYCSNCTPDAKTPTLAIIVKHKDGRTHRTTGIRPIDVRMLRSFLKGERDYMTQRDATQPLKKQIPRLMEMLGLEEEGEEVVAPVVEKDK